MLPQTDLVGAGPVVKRIQAAITGLPVTVKEGEIQIGTSIGLSSNEKDYLLALEQLLERADAALYDAKAAGRNRIQNYEPGQTGDASGN